MKVIFMGTPDFAVPTLKALIKEHEVLAVVTQPDKPKGRGKKVLFTPVKEAALENNIEVLQPPTLKDDEILNKLSKFEADVFVVVAYGQLLPESILKLPKFGCVNVHASLLPKYRGAGPIQWSIIDGESVTGITVMYMEKKLDAGDMLLKKEIKIEPEDTYGSLHDKLALLGAEALTEALVLMEKGELNPEKQDEALSTYAPMLKKDMGLIAWNKSSSEIINLIRGLNPWPSAYTYYKEDMLKIWRAEEVNCAGGEVGEIIDVNPKKGFIVKTGSSALLITEIQAKGGKRMSAADYLRGHEILKGTIL